MTEESIQSKGGKARAKALTPERRSEIARKAAEAKHAIPKATHDGAIELRDIKIPCAVLEDGTRVLTQQGFLRAIGRARSAKGGQGSSVDGMVPFLAAKNLKPFIDNDLMESTTPIIFKPVKGSKAYGYRADLLPKVCEVYLRARDDNELLPSQERVVDACDIIIRGLAHVGITALVDEATGYQEIRDKKALQKILDLYIAKELSSWAKRFPDDFYKEMFRLRGWQWEGMNIKKPQVVGKYTNDLVYERLESGVLDELRRLNPPNEKGNRKNKHHQWLTPDIGHQKLRDHLSGVIALMKASGSWGDFKKLLGRSYPKKGDTIEMPLND